MELLSSVPPPEDAQCQTDRSSQTLLHATQEMGLGSGISAISQPCLLLPASWLATNPFCPPSHCPRMPSPSFYLLSTTSPLTSMLAKLGWCRGPNFYLHIYAPAQHSLKEAQMCFMAYLCLLWASTRDWHQYRAISVLHPKTTEPESWIQNSM